MPPLTSIFSSSMYNYLYEKAPEWLFPGVILLNFFGRGTVLSICPATLRKGTPFGPLSQCTPSFNRQLSYAPLLPTTKYALKWSSCDIFIVLLRSRIPVGVKSIVTSIMFMFVCISVCCCLSASISEKPDVQNSPEFFGAYYVWL